MIEPIRIIQGEVFGLISHLKLNSRWSNSGYYESLLPETNILKSLKNLTNLLHNTTDFNSLDTCAYLEPFLAVIRSNETSGPITGAALTSVNKFLNLFIDENSNNILKGIRNIAESAAHCKFEATDARSDEVVLMKILQVLLSAVKNSAGILLSNELVYEITITCYHMSDQSRSSELLKKTAESTIQEIVNIIFTRYSVYSPPPNPPPLPIIVTTPVVTDTASIPKENIYSIPTTGDNTTNQSLSSSSPSSSSSSIAEATNDEQQDSNKTDFSPNNDLFFSNLPTDTVDSNITDQNITTTTTVTATTAKSITTPTPSPQLPLPINITPTPPNSTPILNTNNNSTFTSPPNLRTSSQSGFILGPRGIRFDSGNQSEKSYDEVVLVKLFKYFVQNSNPIFENEMTRLLCLNLINSIIQIRGENLEEISNILIIIQQDLFKFLLQNLQLKNLPIYSLTMRIIFNLYITLRSTLKSQFEIFFNILLTSITDNKNYSDFQEMALEGLRDFLKLPHTMVDLYVNYDCEMNYTNVFENLCKFLYKNAFPISGPLTMIHLLSLENLLSIIQSIEDRQYKSTHNNSNNDFHRKKELKRQFGVASEYFNRGYREAFEYIRSNQIYSEVSPENIARFLYDTLKINRMLVGEYLGKKSEFNAKVLKEYIHLFDLTSENYLQTFRDFLESFRIPGDAAVIDIILEEFCKILYQKNPLVAQSFPNPDKIYVFLYSGLMLHTSNYNPSVANKDRFTYQSFEKLLLAEKFPPATIKLLYDDIIATEMVVEEPIPSSGITNSIWRNVLKRGKKLGGFVTANSNEYDRDLFSIGLNLLIPAIGKVFEKIENESLSQRILDGFHLCAQISAKYSLDEFIDNLMVSLCNNTTLIEGSENIPTDQHSFLFIGNNKAQLATIATFEIAIKYSNHIGESWKYIISLICKLNKLDVLTKIFEPIDFPIESKKVEKKDLEKNNQTQRSFFRWFVTDGNDVEEKPSVENDKEKAKICVENCHIQDLFLDSKNLPLQSLEHLLQALFIYKDKKDQQTLSSIGVSTSSFSTNNNSNNNNILNSKDNLSTSTSISTSLNNSKEINHSVNNNNNNSNSNTPNVSTPIINNNNFTATTYYLKQELLCFDLLSHIILLNEDRLSSIWSKYYVYIESIINQFDGSKKRIPLIEKVVISLMFLLIRLLPKEEVLGSLEQIVKLLLKVWPILDSSIAEKMSIALVQLVQKNLDFISKRPSVWEPINAIMVLLAGNPNSSDRSCDALSLMVKQDGLTQSTCQFSLETINCFINSKTIPFTVVGKSMELLYYIFTKITDITPIQMEMDNYQKAMGSSKNPTSSIMEKVLKRKLDSQISNVWSSYWSPILRSFSQLCLDTNPNIRNNAMGYLQKSIHSSTLNVLTPQRWFECFVDIIFPLLNGLRECSDDFENTRLRAFAILSKVFLQNLTSIIKTEKIVTLWSEILRFFKEYMSLSELLSESVPESLKNMLLVMNTTGVFKPPTTDSGTIDVSLELWEITWNSINEFCPKIIDDILSKITPPNQIQQEQQEIQQTDDNNINNNNNIIMINPTTDNNQTSPSILETNISQEIQGSSPLNN